MGKMSYGGRLDMLSPELMYKLEDAVPAHGPTVSGVLFGCAWWLWIDAVLMQQSAHRHTVPFVEYLPGIAATLALVLTNSVRREDIAEEGGSSLDDDDLLRSRALLFVAYVIAFASIVSSVVIFINYDKHDGSSYPGVANILLTTLITASSMVMWLTRAPLYGSAY